MATNENGTTAADKRARVALRAYIESDADGKDQFKKTPSDKTTGLKLTFNDPAKTERVYTLADYPAMIQTMAAWHGLSQKIGDVWAGSKGNIDDAIEGADSMNEQLVSGVWTERAEGVGPQPTLVVEAIVRALIAKGETVDDARKLSILEKCKDKATRDGALKDPAIAAQYATIQAERAAARAKAAAEAAAGVTMAEGLAF